MCCGTSPAGYELAKMGHKLTFFDLPDTETFKFLQWRCKKNNIQAHFIDNLDNIPDESLDFVLALDCIEHFPEESAKDMIDKIGRILRKDGMLFCNFLSNVAFEYPEHIFMDKVKFSMWTAKNKLFPMSHFQYLKHPQCFGG
jgi:SAM-dependent methyltransferase